MENAVDALKMASAVLIFVIALSVSIVAFGEVRQTSDAILGYKDRETNYIDSDNYYNSGQAERTVNVESIIPTIYRVYSENYKIVFEGLEEPVYSKLETNGTETHRYGLDSEYDNKILNVGEEEKKCFIEAILYGKQSDLFKKVYLAQNPDGTQISNRKASMKLPSKSLYKQLIEATSITEYIGVYYQDEIEEEPSDGSFDDTNEDNVPDANKTEKRIITYKIN